jgi:hypothetical protein
MRIIQYALTTAAVSALLLMPAIAAHAQVSIGIQLGPEPNCPYGYYDYAPYNCAADGYYGPQWFTNGRFIGAGQWHRGGNNFHGDVNNHYDPQHGYRGAVPARGEAPSHQGPAQNFKGNESRDGHGHSSPKGH